MATTKKAEVTARELLDILGKRVISTLPSQVQSVDSNGNPVITLSADATPATGEKVVVIRVAPQTWTATDALGNTAINYGPHTVEICTELNFAGVTDNVADILTPFELLPVIGDCVKTGCKVLWYSTANGTVPSSSAMTAANLKASYSDLYWGMQKAQ